MWNSKFKFKVKNYRLTFFFNFNECEMDCYRFKPSIINNNIQAIGLMILLIIVAK